MVKFSPAFGFLSVLALVSASPVKRQDSTAASSTAADTAATTAADTAASTATSSAADTAASTAASSAASTDSAATTSAASDAATTGSLAAPETTVTAFVPSPGGPPNGTLYAVTGTNETYLVGLQPVTATDSAGATTTAVLEEIYAVSEDELDYYVFDDQGNVIAATECDISADGTTAECAGVIVDLSATAIAIFNNLTLSGASTGIPAYLPTGTADPSGVSAASNAAARVASFTGGGGVDVSSIGSNTATGTVTPTAIPGGEEDTSLPASAATASSAAESTGTSSSAASTDTAAASSDTAAASTDTAAATTDTAAASTAAASAASTSA